MAADYWSQSEVRALTFDDDESTELQVCGVSASLTAQLSKQVREGLRDVKVTSGNSLFDSEPHHSQKEDRTIKPDLNDLFSHQALNKLFQADEKKYLVIDTLGANEKEEIAILRKQLQRRWDPPDVKITIRNAFLGWPYSFELYKSHSSKKELLAAAEQLGDGDVILEVVLFLSQTLNKTLFNRILRNSPLAVQHYVTYLSTKMKIEKMKDILMMLGRSKDAAIKQFSVLAQSPQKRIDRLQNCSKNHFDSSKDQTFVDNYVNLLKWQQENFNAKFNGESVATMLSLLCSDYWSEVKGSKFSPHTFAQNHGVSSRLFDWVAFNARAKNGAWTDISNLLITKGWLGKPSLRTELPVEHFVDKLHKVNAPQEVLEIYLQFISSPEKKLEAAKKCKLHRAVIDGYLGMRDRLGLVSYKANLDPKSEDYGYAEKILQLSTAKWKN